MQAMCTENAARFDDRGDPARYLTLVVTELRKGRALPKNGRATESGSPYYKYMGSLAHFGCISTTREP
jgi:hypothetical protein